MFSGRTFMIIALLALSLSLVLSACGRIWGGLSRCSYNGSWQTSDTYSYDAISDVFPMSGVADADGSLYVAGYRSVGAFFRWIVRKLPAGQSTWINVDDFDYQTVAGGSAVSMVIGPNRELLVVGAASDAAGFPHGIIRKSSDRGASWATIYDFQFATNKNTVISSIVKDNSGNLFITGYYNDSGGAGHWYTQKSTNGGSSWAFVDDYQYPAATVHSPLSLVVDPNGNLYSGGSVNVGGLVRAFVRSSKNGGATWATVLDYAHFPGFNSTLQWGLGVDKSSNVFVNFFPSDSGAVTHWVILKSSNGGSSWSTIYDDTSGGFGAGGYAVFTSQDTEGSTWFTGFARDSAGKGHLTSRTFQNGTVKNLDDFQFAPAASSFGYTGFTDLKGNMYVAGPGINSGGKRVWVVRNSRLRALRVQGPSTSQCK